VGATQVSPISPQASVQRGRRGDGGDRLINVFVGASAEREPSPLPALFVPLFLTGRAEVGPMYAFLQANRWSSPGLKDT
jgi:hypothetical protein